MRQEFNKLRSYDGGPAWQVAVQTRCGVVIGRHEVQLCLRDSRVRGHISPEIEKGQRWPFFIFRNANADVRTGDLLQTPDGRYWKAYDVRGYPTYINSLQVDLQRIPYSPLALWLPPVKANAGSNGRLKQAYHTKQPVPVLGYIEPGTSQEKAYNAATGSTTNITASLFTLVPVANKSVFVYNYKVNGVVVNEAWEASNNSDHWPVTGDFRTVVELLQTVPVGVTF